MSAGKLNIIRLLALCLLAHTVYCLSIPPQINITESFETATDPPSLHSRSSSEKDGNELEKNVVSSTNDNQEECNNSSHKAVFSGYDYAVLSTMLIISLGIGIFYGFFKNSGSKSANDFMLGSGMTVLPVTLSLATSFITAIELLGNPSEMYYQGTQFLLIVIPMIAVIPVARKVFYPIYFQMQLTSCNEYLGIRFGKEIRIFAALLYVVQMSFYTSVAVLAPAIALSKVTGLNTKIAVVLIYLVCIFYSSQGGMKAVVIADTFQAAVLAFSLVLIIVLGFFYSGGPIEIFHTADERDRLEFFNFSLDPTRRHTAFSVVIGGFFYWTSLFCTNQASVQKCMSLKTLKPAKAALSLAIVGLVLVFLLNFYTGLTIHHHYIGCDPLLAGRITASDQLLPYYIINTYEQVYSVAGIFVAGIFAASLGTVASALNSLSAVTCEDLLIDGLNIKISQEKGVRYVKWMSLGFGTFSFALVFIVEHLGGVLQATLTLNGLIGGVTLGLFVLGMAFPRANTKGALYGGLVALFIVIIIGVVAQVANTTPQPLSLSVDRCDCAVNATFVGDMNQISVDSGFMSWAIFKVSYMWYSMIGTLLTLFFGFSISVILSFIQQSKVLKINSSKAMEASKEPNWKLENVATLHNNGSAANPDAAVFTVSNAFPKHNNLGHVNHAVRLDDE